MFPPEVLRQLDSGNAADLKPVFAELMKAPGPAFAFNRGMLVHGCATPLEYVRAFRAYTLESAAERITCPTLVTEAENDSRASQAHELYDALTCPKELIAFTAAEGAGEHCESGADSLFHQRAFDWLDGVLAGA
jgi:pimeloyl-ACP methyl ester carboxylesterase